MLARYHALAEYTIYSYLNPTYFIFSTTISSQQLSHSSQQESDFRESTAEPNKP